MTQLIRTASLGIIISPSKTEYVTINCNPFPKTEVNGTSFGHVITFKYMDFLLSS